MRVSQRNLLSYLCAAGACVLALAVAGHTPSVLGQDRTGTSEVRGETDKTGFEERKDCRIKGDVSLSGAFIYYLPSHPDYNDIKIIRYNGGTMFCTEGAARAAGWKPAP